MSHPSEAPSDLSLPAEHWLQRALRARGPEHRIAHAAEGLALPEEDVAPDTRVLLLRQIYLGHLEMLELGKAAEIARTMSEVGPLRDVALHDRARALAAAGDLRGAIAAQRLAARAAPAARKSFMAWGLATLQHFDGDVEGALRTLKRALRYSQRDRPLLEAHAAYVRLSEGRAVRSLSSILATLRNARAGQGYGQFLLGMISYHMGDPKAARVHLRHFLRRNARADVAKSLTLREELRRARTALAELESD